MTEDDRPLAMGDRVQDRVTGFTGTITGEAFYMNGNHQFLVEPSIHPTRGYEKAAWFDAHRLAEAPETMAYFSPRFESPNRN